MSDDTTQEHPGISAIKKHLESQEAQAQEQQAIDFAGQQGDQGAMQVGEEPQQPQQQSAPPQQPAQQPAQMQHPQLTQLSAPQIASNYNADMAQSQQAYNQGTAEQEGAAQQNAAVNMQNNDANAQALQQHAALDNQFQAVRNGIDEYHMSVTQQAVGDMQKDVAQQEQLLNSNPHNWWGNATVPNKIAAIVGMIGAGLHGDNASEYFQRIVNNSVAESQRKQQALGHLGMARNRLLNAQNQLAENQAANLDARKAAGYGYIENQLKQRIAMTKNPQEVANLNDQLGKIHVMAAKHQEEGANNMVNHNLSALKTQLEVERMGFEQQRLDLDRQKGGRERQSVDDEITKQSMAALKGNPELNRIDTRIAQLEPAIHVLRHNPDATSPQIQQILLQVLNGEIGGRVPTEMLEHMTPNSYLQKFQEQKARLTNNPQDAYAKAFLDKTADIAEQTLVEIKKQKEHKRRELLKPLSPRMSDELKHNLNYTDEQAEQPDAPKEPTDAERARAIMDKYK